MAKGVKIFHRGKAYRDNFDGIFYGSDFPDVPENGDAECQAELFPNDVEDAPPSQVTE